MDGNASAAELNSVLTVVMSLSFPRDAAGNWRHLFNGVDSAPAQHPVGGSDRATPGKDAPLTGEAPVCSAGPCS